jgi:hypothetical protein
MELSEQEAYKKACDEVLIPRALNSAKIHEVKLVNGSSLEFLLKLVNKGE